MKAAYIDNHGDIENIKVGDLRSPQINPNEVLIESRYAALNHIDIFIVKGWPGLDLKKPHIIGADVSGVIKEIGSEVSTLKVGDKVAVNPGLSCGKCKMCLSGKQNLCKDFEILGEKNWGTFSEFVKVPEINAIKVPEEYPLDKAAAASLVFLTAWRMLYSLAKVKFNDFVFIHGVGGGVGSAALQIAKFFGAKAIVSSSSDEKLEEAKKLGADYVINYQENPDFRNYVYSDLTKRHGIDIVVDSVGSATFETSLKMLNTGGRLVNCGATSGPKVSLDIRFLFWKHLKIIGSTMSNQKEYRDVMELIFERKLKPIIDKQFDLENVIEAEKYLERGAQFGKVVLKF